MKVENFIPREGFIVVRKAVVDSVTDSGFEVEENSDDFLIHAEIVSSGSSDFIVGSHVVFHALEAQEFRDGSDTFLLVHSDYIVGTYKT